jgi:hypothetical protein
MQSAARDPMGSYACWSRSLDRVAVTFASRHLLEMSGHCLNNEGLPCPGLAINLEVVGVGESCFVRRQRKVRSGL